MSAPTVGRIVHWTGDDGKCLAAIVTVEQDEIPLLTVFAPTGPTLLAPAGFAEDRAPGTWHWPERA